MMKIEQGKGAWGRREVIAINVEVYLGKNRMGRPNLALSKEKLCKRFVFLILAFTQAQGRIPQTFFCFVGGFSKHNF